jgi:riboflavin transporter
MKRTTYNIVISGLFVALSIVLTRLFSANLMIANVPASRLSIGLLPIILSSIISGPGWGMAVGALADTLGFLLFPSGVYYPPITLTSILVGLLPWLVYRITGKSSEWLKVLLSVAAVQILCSMFLQTYWISRLYGKVFLVLFYPRAIVSLITIPIYYIFVYSILKGLKRARLLPSQPGVTSH